jgi:spore maturation protein SpmB
VIALRAAAGSNDPAGILPTTLIATTCSTIIAIVAAKLYRKFMSKTSEIEGPEPENNVNAGDDVEMSEGSSREYPFWVSGMALLCLLALIPLTIVSGKSISPWIIPLLMVGFLTFGILRKVHIYEVFVEGAKDGFQVAVKIIPYLVAILVSVGMLRASGAMEAIVGAIGSITAKIGMPAEALPMALLRPLSGSGAYGILASVINDPNIGPDSYTGYLVSTLQGSTETTFYVLAVYFGSVQIKRIRHAMAAAITADVGAIIAAVVICKYLYG